MKKLYLMLTFLGFLQLNAQNALDFDGASDYVDCGNDTSLQISGKYITLEAWIYPTAWKTNADDGNIIAKEYNTSNYGYMLRCGAGGKLNFALGDGSWHEITTASTVLSLNTWQHVAGTFDGNKMRLYLNGVCIDSLAFNGTISKTPNNNLYVGAHLTYSRYYQGIIDEVRIWSICKTANEIANGYTDEICSSQNGLRLYFKFSQGKASQNNPSVKKVNDMSGYGNNGTLYSFNLTGSTSNWVKGVTLKKAATNVSLNADACDRYTSPSRKFTWIKSGTYYDTIPTYFGCDSAITVNLTIRKSSTFSFGAFACDSFKSPSGSTWWKKSGTYVDKIKNNAGCDSTITVILQIGGGKDTIYPVVCNKYTTPSGKRSYTVSGQYFDTLKNYRNCDSIIDIRLTVNTNKNSSVTLKGCKQVISPSGKKIFKSNGVYGDTLKTKTGCDSFVTVTVILLNNTATVTAKACKSYTSPDLRHTWTQSGVYKDTLTNVSFCDSVITYNITITQPSSASIDVTACGFYISPGKHRKWKKSGVYKDTLTNAKGCDSILTIRLTIPKTNIGVNQNGKHLSALSATGSFRWLNCTTSYSFISGETNKNFTAPAIGNYAVEVTDSGCIDTSACYTVNSISVNSIHAPDQVKVSPNPGNGSFDIETPKDITNAKIRITDLSGRVIYEADYENFRREHLELSASPGTYLLEIIAETYHALSFLNIN